MSKHPLDHDHGSSNKRLEKFAEVERANQPSHAAKTLQQRAKGEPDSRLERYTRIERGVYS
ncbi:MAG: hypothetical protein Kow0013_09510 [Pararhodobacter sp.]